MAPQDPSKESRPTRTRGASIPLSRLYLGFVLVGAGLLMLASNAGWIPFHIDIRGRILWPLLIMLVGLSMVNVRGWLGGLLGVPLVLVLAALTLFAIVRTDRSIPRKTQTVDIEKMAGATSARMAVSMGAGRLYVTGGASSLANGVLESWILGASHHSRLEDGGVQRVDIHVTSRWPDLVSGGDNDFHVSVTDALPVALKVDAGAAVVRLNLETDRKSVV